MKIGIDISQTAYKSTGVANYLSELVEHLAKIDKKNQYILFFSSLRREVPEKFKKLGKNFKIKQFKLPPTALDLAWNRLHILKVEDLIGKIDLFITSDWTEPPVRHAKKATIIYDLIVYTNPDETSSKIVETQKKKLQWVKKESDLVFTISQSSKNDIHNILKMPLGKIKVIYPGI